MPAYRPLDARFTGVVADATRRADELYGAGDLSGAMSALEGALAQSLTTPPRFPSWAVMRLAFVYRRLKRYPDEVELLERSLPHQTDEAARRRVLLRLAKARSMVARLTPREPSRLITPREGAPRVGAATRGDPSPRTVMALHAATHHVGVEFLRAELDIAETMLTLAAASSDDAVRTRRYARASEAAAEVMAHLVADGSPIRWTDAEHEELSRKLWSLARRIRAAADRRTLDSMFDALVPDASRRQETNGGTADGPRA